MLKDFGAALLKDFIGVMKKEASFFSLNKGKRREILHENLGVHYPVTFIDYITEVSGEVFMGEMKEMVEVISGRAYAKPENRLLNVMAHYISEVFAEHFDRLNLSFFFEGIVQRSKKLNSLFPGHSSLETTVKDRLLRGTYQELSAAASHALSYLKDSPLIVIQSPVELDSELRVLIRSHINKKYPYTFAEFQVNPQLIGGMRVFVGGRVVDHSWLSKIQALTRLTFNNPLIN